MDTPDPLNDQLSDLADAIAVDDAEMSLSTVRGIAAHRRRRRSVIGGTAAAVALIGGVVVIAGGTGDGQPDSIAIDGANAETPTTEPSADEAVVGGTPTDSMSSDDVPGAAPSVATTRVDTIAANATTISMPADAEGVQSDLEWIVPWQNGFLAGSIQYTPQPLPSELPEEVTALFSQEVLDLFADGLPATIDEATAMLSEAGLLDEVTQVLSDNPAANAAVFSTDGGGPTTDVLFSVDGADWEPIEFNAPGSAYGLYGVQSTGTRLAVAIQTFDDALIAGTEAFDEQTPGIAVATTTDLLTWDIIDVEAPARPADLSEAFFYSVSPGTLAMTDVGWVLPLNTYSDIDIDSLLPADLRNRLYSGTGGYSLSYDDQGISIEILGNAPVVTSQVEYSGSEEEYVEPDVVETITLSWEELGVDPMMPDAFDQRSLSSAVAATWGGTPQTIDGVDAWSVTAAGDGFYAPSGATVGYSADGVTWSTLDVPGEDLSANAVKALPDAALVFASDNDGLSTVFRVSGADGEWELLDIPGAPSSMFDVFGVPSSAPAMLVDGAAPVIPEPTEITAVADGYTMVLGQDRSMATLTVTDADGEIVASESHDWRSSDEPTTWRFGQRGIDILDAETGEVIVTFDSQVLDAAYEAQASGDEQVVDYDPDLWLVATVDGDRWLVEDLETDIDFNQIGPGAIALNGNTLVISIGGDWMRYDLS